jgi:hypothetical protein
MITIKVEELVLILGYKLVIRDDKNEIIFKKCYAKNPIIRIVQK